MPSLFDPLKIGDLEVPNRVFMAPLTRNRSTGAGARSERDDARLLRRSARPPALFFPRRPRSRPRASAIRIRPGVWSDEQVEGWRSVVKGVHGAGGRIFLQLWHVGRISDPSYHDGALPVGPSAIAPKGNVSLLRPQRAYVAPRALKTEELADVVAAYRRGAENAKDGRVRRRRDPRRERLSARPVPAGLEQQARRRLWRFGRESRPPHARSDGRRGLRLGAGPGRHAPRPARRRA